MHGRFEKQPEDCQLEQGGHLLRPFEPDRLMRCKTISHRYIEPYACPDRCTRKHRDGGARNAEACENYRSPRTTPAPLLRVSWSTIGSASPSGNAAHRTAATATTATPAITAAIRLPEAFSDRPASGSAGGCRSRTRPASSGSVSAASVRATRSRHDSAVSCPSAYATSRRVRARLRSLSRARVGGDCRRATAEA